MAWLALFLLTLLHCTGSLSQPALTQSPSASAALKASVKLTCILKSDYSSYFVNWFQQSPGKGIRYIMSVGTSGMVGSKGEGIPDRFSGSSSGPDRFLTIQNIQEEDEADYYCGVPISSGSNYVYIFGSGTDLSVVGGPTSAPQVTLFPPSPEETKKNKATLVCLANDFYPKDIKITWKADGRTITNGVDTSKPTKLSNDKYSTSSYLSMTPQEWQSKRSVSCEVTHEGTTVVKTVSPS